MAKAYQKSKVISSLAASNTWLIGMLLVLVGVVFVVWYNYSTYKDVKGVATKSAEFKNGDNRSAASGSAQLHDDANPSNGCFVLKGNLLVSQSCGTNLYRSVQYTCGDNKKITLGGTTSCKTIATWLATVAFQCKGHTSCDAKNATPTPRVSGHPEISRRPSTFPSKTPPATTSRQ